jgi:hypothetical protein
MNAYEVVLKPARGALILFALSVIIAIVVVAGLARYRAAKEQAILQTEQQLNATRDNITKLTSDLDTINRLAEKYRKLTRLGLVGEADRDGWVQRLETLYRDTRLPPTLRYTLAPPQLINPQPVSPDAPSVYLNNVTHHDLALELSGIHDGEFLDFMDKLSADWKAPYRVDTCQISREAEVLTGLQIRCTVQLYSLPGKAVVSR